jgi:hypothetical protein
MGLFIPNILHTTGYGLDQGSKNRINAFESQFRENAPRRRYAISKSNALALVLKTIILEFMIMLCYMYH